MTNSIVDDLLGQLQGEPLAQIASQLGTDNTQAGNAIAAALPMLLGALGNNAQSAEGASGLLGALQRDHMGAGGLDLGGLLGGLLGGGGAQAGAGGILGHIFGGTQPDAEAGLGQATGLSSGQSGQLLQMLAPMVMGYLANRVSSGGMDAGALGNLLGQEQANVQQQGGLGSSLLNAVLDQNGDGKLDLGDLVKLGSSFLSRR